MDASRRELVADIVAARGSLVFGARRGGRGCGFGRVGLLLLAGAAGWGCPSGNGVVVVPPPAEVVESSGPAMISATVSARAWPEADSLFHKEAAWLGGDIASSMPSVRNKARSPGASAIFAPTVYWASGRIPKGRPVRLSWALISPAALKTYPVGWPALA